MADTLVNTLYPPVIETFQPAFLYDQSASITFSISGFNNAADIKKVHVSVVDQRNNSNVLIGFLDKQAQFTDSDYSYCIVNGILIADFPEFEETDEIVQKGFFKYDSLNDIYAIDLDPQWLNRDGNSNYWNNNQYYQVQIRFDKNDKELPKGENLSGYLFEYRKLFSEWSSITLIKSILYPSFFITQLRESQTKEIAPGSYHLSGSMSFDYKNEEDNNLNGLAIPETERLQSYRVIALKEEIPIYDSNWVYARQNIIKSENNTIECLLDFSDCETGDEIDLTIYGKTNNGYEWKQKYDLIIGIPTQDDFVAGSIQWNNNDNLDDDIVEVNQEDGIAKIRFQAKTSHKSIIYFRRASSRDDFKIWDLIYRYEHDGGENLTISFDDYTIGSLYQYQYSAQLCILNNKQELWGPIHKTKYIYPKFYEMLLMRQNRQIAIRYNGQVSSWKPTVNRQKIDTLGGRYPKFVENAVMNYKTYSISGVISAEDDFNRRFLHEFDGKYENNEWQSSYFKNIQAYNEEFNGKYVIRNDTDADGEYGYNPKNGINEYLKLAARQEGFENIKGSLITTQNTYAKYDKQIVEQHDLYPQNNWYWEREFREELVNWLNDGEPKLYRSMPEGNIAVVLTDINLTPNTQLGRMLYNFTATMYEVADGYNLEHLDNLGIIDIPHPNAIFINGAFNDRNVVVDKTGLGETKYSIGYGTISSGERLSDWINLVRDLDDNTNSFNHKDLWNNMTVKEKLDEQYYKGEDDTQYEVISNSIALSNINIQFTSPPHYFRINNGQFELNLNTDNKEEKSQWLGYLLNITQKDGLRTFTQQIFVNQKGYYHIPNSIEIINFSIPALNSTDNTNFIQQLNFNYQYTYRIKQSEKAKAHLVTTEKYIVGQYTDDKLPLNTDIISLIHQNHAKKNYKMNNIYDELINMIYLYYCAGVMLDITPYSVIEYVHYSEDPNNVDDTVYQMIIGSTGVFDGLQDWPLSQLVIRGRRLTEVEDYPFHIEEWNYYKDDTVTGDTEPTKLQWINLQDLLSTNIDVVLNINGQKFQKIENNWKTIINSKYQDYEKYGFLSTQQVQNPKFNTVYTFLKSVTGTGDNEQIEYCHKIYYIDGKWYPVTFMEDNSIIAAVPIYGMINYQGRLVKRWYE